MAAELLLSVRESCRSTPLLPEYDTSSTLRQGRARWSPSEKLFTCGSRNLVLITLNDRPAKVSEPSAAPLGNRMPSGNGSLILLFSGSLLSSAENTSGVVLLKPDVCR